MGRAAAGLLAALCGVWALAGCATPAPPPSAPPAQGSPPPPYPGDTNAFAALPGWAEDDHLAAFEAYRRTCHVARDEAYRAVCADARRQGALDRQAARAFFETRFQPRRVEPAGLLTAYFAPEYEARRKPDAEFSAPLRPKPTDLVLVDGARIAPEQAGRKIAAQEVAGLVLPYPERAVIEAQPAERPLAWLRAEDKLFLQIQGSGYLTFEDGARARAAYAADNGRPFVGVARPMAERGLLPRDGTSGEAIRAWLSAHRGPEAQAIIDLNPRYVFFALQPDDGGHPAGAAGLLLPAGRAVAVDPAHRSYGEPLWLDADGATLRGALRGYRRLVMALDTGGAIRGAARADLYLGRGPAAGAEAGTVRHPLTMWKLVPR
jgi:membrane-bound lytic murein transglycosylase A